MLSFSWTYANVKFTDLPSVKIFINIYRTTRSSYFNCLNFISNDQKGILYSKQVSEILPHKLVWIKRQKKLNVFELKIIVFLFGAKRAVINRHNKRRKGCIRG